MPQARASGWGQRVVILATLFRERAGTAGHDVTRPGRVEVYVACTVGHPARVRDFVSKRLYPQEHRSLLDRKRPVNEIETGAARRAELSRMRAASRWCGYG